MLRRTVVTLAAAAALAGAAAAPASALLPGGGAVPPAKADSLSFTVRDSTDRAMNGSFTLDCHPSGGSHPDAAAACDAIDEAARKGTDLFAPVAEDAECTMVYGGPVTARVQGTWHGKPVDARFDRSNGCEINRWNALVPALPEAA
ncbi:SSI family serine proteinase inhibitor [Streptomyces phytohabitans]|uniref:SSI family serine proteinase inhibitor n=1 Tax=Streptomyces phytohabitans TaxID=1150371 RepID=UPI00345BD710